MDNGSPSTIASKIWKLLAIDGDGEWVCFCCFCVVCFLAGCEHVGVFMIGDTQFFYGFCSGWMFVVCCCCGYFLG